MVPEVLKMTQFVNQDGMAKMQIRGSRIEPRLDPQRAPCFELLNQFCLNQEFINTSFDYCQTFIYCVHSLPFTWTLLPGQFTEPSDTFADSLMVTKEGDDK